MTKNEIHHFENWSIKRSGVELELDMSRIEKNLNKAQFALDSAIMTSMEPYMPMDTASLIARTKAESAALAGKGYVIAAVPPYGRFQYEGKVMVGVKSKSAWAKKAEKKITTGENLKYSRASAKAHWFDEAKKKDEKKWVKIVKEEVGKK